MIERRDLPLFRWGEELRERRRRRRRRARRTLILGAGIACLATTIAVPPAPRLVWNASASAPIGLYAVVPGAPAARGDMVVARLPAGARRLAANRHYLPLGVPLVKRVAAIAGDRVCAAGDTISINGASVTRRLRADRAGRPMPHWAGCRLLSQNDVFLLMADVPSSFDGRYFGPTPGTDVVGRATPLWVAPAKGSSNG